MRNLYKLAAMSMKQKNIEFDKLDRLTIRNSVSDLENIYIYSILLFTS